MFQQFAQKRQGNAPPDGKGIVFQRFEHGQQAVDVAPPVVQQIGENIGRDAKLALYRSVRDQIQKRMIERFGPPTAG